MFDTPRHEATVRCCTHHFLFAPEAGEAQGQVEHAGAVERTRRERQGLQSGGGNGNKTVRLCDASVLHFNCRYRL